MVIAKKKCSTFGLFDQMIEPVIKQVVKSGNTYIDKF